MPTNRAQSSTPSLSRWWNHYADLAARRISECGTVRGIGRGPNGVLLIKGVLEECPLRSFHPFPSLVAPATSPSSTRNEPSRRQRAEQGENGSAYRAGATVLTVPHSARHRETIITSHGSFDVPRRVRTPPRGPIHRCPGWPQEVTHTREPGRKVPARSISMSGKIENNHSQTVKFQD